VAKVTFFLGLAGSGKSHCAEELKAQTGAEIFEGTEGEKKEELLRAMVQQLNDGKNCIVEEIAYCLPSRREAIVATLCRWVPNIEIEWICFENDLESANWNVRNRKHKSDAVQSHLHINQCYHGLYIYPGGAKVKPITRTNENKTTP
jgi:adenosyl cobinamide kinase/adenosyl cobinamide phosphate guanylyltransferase